MAIKVTLAKAHQSQLDDVEIKKELCSVEAELNKVELPFQKDTINFVFIKRRCLQHAFLLTKWISPLQSYMGFCV